MAKPNIHKADPKVVPPHIPAPKRGDETRNLLVNLLEDIDGAQAMKDAGKPQEEVIAYVESSIAKFKASPGIFCDGGAIFFGITLGRITLDITYTDEKGEIALTYMARRF